VKGKLTGKTEKKPQSLAPKNSLSNMKIKLEIGIKTLTQKTLRIQKTAKKLTKQRFERAVKSRDDTCHLQPEATP
jgi:hypothetical protein